MKKLKSVMKNILISALSTFVSIVISVIALIFISYLNGGDFDMRSLFYGIGIAAI